VKTLLLVEVGVHDVRRFTDGGRITLDNEEFESAQSRADAMLAVVEAARLHADQYSPSLCAALAKLDAVEEKR
jgi:hypothetical protein